MSSSSSSSSSTPKYTHEVVEKYESPLGLFQVGDVCIFQAQQTADNIHQLFLFNVQKCSFVLFSKSASFDFLVQIRSIFLETNEETKEITVFAQVTPFLFYSDIPSLTDACPWIAQIVSKVEKPKFCYERVLIPFSSHLQNKIQFFDYLFQLFENNILLQLNTLKYYFCTHQRAQVLVPENSISKRAKLSQENEDYIHQLVYTKGYFVQHPELTQHSLFELYRKTPFLSERSLNNLITDLEAFALIEILCFLKAPPRELSNSTLWFPETTVPRYSCTLFKTAGCKFVEHPHTFRGSFQDIETNKDNILTYFRNVNAKLVINLLTSERYQYLQKHAQPDAVFQTQTATPSNHAPVYLFSSSFLKEYFIQEVNSSNFKIVDPAFFLTLYPIQSLNNSLLPASKSTKEGPTSNITSFSFLKGTASLTFPESHIAKACFQTVALFDSNVSSTNPGLFTLNKKNDSSIPLFRVPFLKDKMDLYSQMGRLIPETTHEWKINDQETQRLHTWIRSLLQAFHGGSSTLIKMLSFAEAKLFVKDIFPHFISPELLCGVCPLYQVYTKMHPKIPCKVEDFCFLNSDCKNRNSQACKHMAHVLFFFSSFLLSRLVVLDHILSHPVSFLKRLPVDHCLEYVTKVRSRLSLDDFLCLYAKNSPWETHFHEMKHQYLHFSSLFDCKGDRRLIPSIPTVLTHLASQWHQKVTDATPSSLQDLQQKLQQTDFRIELTDYQLVSLNQSIQQETRPVLCHFLIPLVIGDTSYWYNALNSTLLPASLLSPKSFVGGGFFADDLGLGKTIKALSLICYSKTFAPLPSSTSTRSLETTLLLCPLDLITQWQREIQQKTNLSVFVIDKKLTRTCAFVKGTKFYDVYLLPFTRIASSSETLATIQQTGHVWKRIIIDECHLLTSLMVDNIQTLLETKNTWLLSGNPCAAVSSFHGCKSLLVYLSFWGFCPTIWSKEFLQSLEFEICVEKLHHNDLKKSLNPKHVFNPKILQIHRALSERSFQYGASLNTHLSFSPSLDVPTYRTGLHGQSQDSDMSLSLNANVLSYPTVLNQFQSASTETHQIRNAPALSYSSFNDPFASNLMVQSYQNKLSLLWFVFSRVAQRFQHGLSLAGRSTPAFLPPLHQHLIRVPITTPSLKHLMNAISNCIAVEVRQTGSMAAYLHSTLKELWLDNVHHLSVDVSDQEMLLSFIRIYNMYLSRRSRPFTPEENASYQLLGTVSPPTNPRVSEPSTDPLSESHYPQLPQLPPPPQTRAGPPRFEMEQGCAVCLSAYSNPVVLYNCAHCFCFSCILPVVSSFKKVCPLCRAPFTADHLFSIHEFASGGSSSLPVSSTSSSSSEHSVIQTLPHKMSLVEEVHIQMPLLHPKLQLFLEKLSSSFRANPHKKVLVFVSSATLCEKVKSHLERCSIPSLCFHSSLSSELRQQTLDSFSSASSSVFALLTTFQTASHGLNLQQAEEIYFLNHSYSYVMEQSICRSWRIGQTKPVSVFYFVNENTFEEKLLKKNIDYFHHACQALVQEQKETLSLSLRFEEQTTTTTSALLLEQVQPQFQSIQEQIQYISTEGWSRDPTSTSPLTLHDLLFLFPITPLFPSLASSSSVPFSPLLTDSQWNQFFQSINPCS